MKRAMLDQYKIYVSAEKKSVFMSLILHYELHYISACIDENKQLVVTIKGRDKREYIRCLESGNIKYTLEKVQGRLAPIFDLRRRFGLIIGLILIICGISYSSKIVWEINVTGNSTMSYDDVINELSEAGFTKGSYIPGIDYDVLHNKILMNSDRLSWVSVNISGTVANVMVKEYKKSEEKDTPLYSNVVAKSDGYIASISVLNGKKSVSIGDVVKKGDILISGVIDSQSQGVRLETAQGNVKAYVNKEIKVKIPFSYEKKVYTNDKYINKIYKIFNFPIKFSLKYGNQDVLYDTIEKKEQLSLFGITDLPIDVLYTTYYGYVLEPVCLTLEQAEEIALVRLRESMDVLLSEAELVNKSVRTYYDDEYFYLDCSVYCIEDIAQLQEIFVLE